MPDHGIVGEEETFPVNALLGGGAYDSLASLGGRGGPEEKLRRLSEALASGTGLQVIEHFSQTREGSQATSSRPAIRANPPASAKLSRRR